MLKFNENTKWLTQQGIANNANVENNAILLF